MNKIIRVKFTRGEDVKYVSHLDLMKTFERAIRRAGIPLAYSQGFNPHPGIVFGLPLSVGVTSEAEYADFEMSDEISEEEFINKFNTSLPDGLIATATKTLDEKGNIMKSIAAAQYDILVSAQKELELNALCTSMEKLLAQSEILVEKESKGKIRKVDIRSMIYGVAVSEICLENNEQSNTARTINFAGNQAFEVGEGDFVRQYLLKVQDAGWKTSYTIKNVHRISLFLSAGSEANLKPGLFFAAFKEDEALNMVKVHRTGLFIEKAGKIIMPM